MTVAVVGATGYTGALIVRELLARDTPFVAVARDASKLDALPGDFERRVADASDLPALRSAIDGCTAAVSTVGPFIDLGEPVVQACAQAGVHYIDITGEQAFMRMIFDRYAHQATAVIPAMGFDYVPGDMAAALAVRELGRPPDSLDVFYVIRGAKTSFGTKRTGLRVAQLPCLTWQDGSLVEEKMGGEGRTFDFPDGEANVALWPGGEPITVPRHTGARNVRTFMRMPKAAAAMMRGASMATPAIKAGSAAVSTARGGPSDQERAKGHYHVVAVADGVRCAVEGSDMYGMTATACAEALVRMAEPTFAASGALAPSEAFEPESFLRALDRHLTWRIEE